MKSKQTFLLLNHRCSKHAGVRKEKVQNNYVQKHTIFKLKIIYN